MKSTLTAASAILLLAVQAAAAQGTYREYGHMWDGGHMWFGAIWMLLSFAILVALVAGAVLLVRRLWHLGPGEQGPRRRALDLLDERYAKGEIEREEYLRRKQDLAG